MAKITASELATVANKVADLVKQFDIEVKVSEPNAIALLIPNDMSFNDKVAMTEFARHVLAAAGIHIYADLEFVFFKAGMILDHVVIHGLPREQLN